MTRFFFGLLAGLAAVGGCALVLWFTLPFVFSAVSGASENWLGWLPFSVFIPALLFGGYTAARIVPVRRVTLGFVVGLVAAVVVGFLARGTGQALYLSIAVLLGGVLSAIGARLAGKHAVSL
jgi:hypothetical protein